MKRSFPTSLVLTVAAFAAGYGTSHWMSAPGTAVRDSVKGSTAPKASAAPKAAAAAAVPGVLPVSVLELRLAITDQQARVAENRRRLEEVKPDVPAIEARYERASAMLGKLSQPGLPEKDLMELTASLGGAGWMPDAISEYRKAQEEYRVMGERYGGKHPRMITADDRLSAMGGRMTAEAERVFKETENLTHALEQALPEAREKAARALEHPELVQPLEQALRESRERLEELQQRLMARTGRQVVGNP